MLYILVDNGKEIKKMFYKNKLELFVLKIYCYFKHYEIF